MENPTIKGNISVAVLLLITMGAGCVHVPEQDPERALFLDLERIVSTRERTTEWVVDRVEAEQEFASLLRSVCQTKPEARKRLALWLGEEITLAGGSSEEVYEKNGQDLDAADDILRLERIQFMLNYADQKAADECPFWLKPDEDFRGVHSDADRLILLLESNGGAWILFRGEDALYGGGGAARFSVGWGFSEKLTVALGAELGGSGTVNQGSDDAESSEFAANFHVGVPLLFRIVDASRLYDVEIAAIALTNPQKDIFQPGIRGLVGSGLATPRIGAFMPAAVFMVGYEFYPAASGLPTTHLLRAGTRVGINFDP